MAGLSYIIVIVAFIVYYFAILLTEKKLVNDPKVIIEKFLSIALLYAGISLIYFAITNKPLFTDDQTEYSIYIFIIGFIAVLWAIPNLLSEFRFFRKFEKPIKNSKKITKTSKALKKTKK